MRPPSLLSCLFHTSLVIASHHCALRTPHRSRPNVGSGASTATSGSSTSQSGVPTTTAFPYGTEPIRGVNLGGWLVLEPWITPSLFESTNSDKVIDEYTLGQFLGPQAALNILQQHWKTWIIEDDFAAIKAAGLTHVRIPLGYWSVPLTSANTNGSTDTSPYTPGAWPYLLQALTWAKKHSVRVIVDIHGAPGSQNGYDNSGQRTNNPQWANNPANVSRTLDAVRYIVENVGGMIDAIELLNEPAAFLGGTFPQVIRQFWSDGYEAVRQVSGTGIQVMIGDAFLGVSSWNNFLTYPQAEGVLMDNHVYQIFSDLELNRTFDERIQFACAYSKTLSTFQASNIWTIIGEWSTAITDCAQWLNGRGIGARWDGTWSPSSQYHGSCANMTGSYHNFSASYKAFLRRYWEVQVDIGEIVSGWMYWTWKAENADDWSYQKGLEGGWIPSDPTDRMYPGICS